MLNVDMGSFKSKHPRRRNKPKRKLPRLLQLEQLESRELLDAGLTAPAITQLYQDLLHRTPADLEIASWQANLPPGSTTQQVAQGILGSDEYRGDQVQADYAGFLSRQASPTELQSWIQTGLGQARLEAAILGSDEYYAGHGRNAGTWITGLYQDVLNRNPDAAGLAQWQGLLAAGMSRQAVAWDIVNSSEAHTDLVKADYLQLLNRPADPPSLARWTATLDQGAPPSTVILGIVGSAEYSSKVASPSTSGGSGAANTSAPLNAIAPVLLQTFTLQDAAGIANPQQIVTFDVDPSINLQQSLYLLGPDGNPAPFQILPNNKIAVDTGLPAGTQLLWQLYSGQASSTPSVTNPVVVTQGSTYYQITNGITGVRVPLATSNLAYPPAPIQGILYQDGTWTGTGPNFLSAAAQSMNVQFVESGPLETVVQVRYAVCRADIHDAEGNDYPGGVGQYTSTITLQAGQPSIMMQEDTDSEVSYSVDVYSGLQPTQGSYRGMNEVNSGSDSTVNLQFATPQSYPRMAVWNPWIENSGWYWQLYNAQGSANSNLFGIFAGPASTALGADNSGTNLATLPQGVNALVSKMDAGGRMYTVYQSGPNLWFNTFNSSMQPNTPQLLGSGLINPDVEVLGGGQVSIVAYSQSQQQFINWQGSANSTLTPQPINLGASSSWSVTDPYAYQAHTSAGDFLLLIGYANGQRAFLLFDRPTGQGTYTFQQAVLTFQDWLPPNPTPQQVQLYSFRRPAFAALPSGQVVLVYTDPGGYAGLATIAAGALDFGQSATTNSLYKRFPIQSYGQSIDPQTGNITVIDANGDLILLSPQGGQLAAVEASTSLGLPTQTGRDTPNPTDVATDTQGNVVAYERGQFYLFQGGQWAPLAVANQLNLANPVVSFSPATGTFVFQGQSNGMLTIYTWKVGDAAAVQVNQLAGTAQPGMTITMSTDRLSPDTSFYPEVRFSWGIYTGTLGASLLPPNQVQPINQQMNLHGGINLNKTSRYHLSYADPLQGYGALYMNSATIQQMILKLQTDRVYHDYLYNAEPTARPLIDMWVDTTGAAVHTVAQEIVTLAQKILNAMVNGYGIYDPRYQYWEGGLAMQGMGDFIDSVLADPLVTADDKAQVKAAAAIFANILWDNDFAPMFNGHGLNMGTANMPVQEQGYQSFYALLLSQSPDMQPHVSTVFQSAFDKVDHIINASGAEMSSPHYIAASLEPTLDTLLQIRQVGGPDDFALDPRLTQVAYLLLNLQTPPEVRFGGLRKLIAEGDGSTEGTDLFGILATGFSPDNPQLAAQLQQAWVDEGSPQSGFFGTTLLKINQFAPTAPYTLGDANFTGYDSVLRDAFGTSNETALWFMNGDFLSDHRHYDQGSLVAYALGVPLMVNWSSVYTPQTEGSAMQSTVTPLSQIPWSQSTLPLDAGKGWQTSTLDNFVSLPDSGMSQADFISGNTDWTRSVYSIHPNTSAPIILIRDSFANASEPMVMSMNLMAQGSISTASGSITPPQSAWANNQQLPTFGQAFSLSSGVNDLGFTGQFGVNYDLYSITSSSQTARVANWTDNWITSPEDSQYAAAHNRQPFQESQDMLEVQGTGPFTTLILPYQAGQRPSDLQVTQSRNTIIVVANGTTTTIGDSWYTSQSNSQFILSAFGSSGASFNGLGISGGPAEIVRIPHQMTIIVTGSPGVRNFTLPAGLQIDPTQSNATLTYSGGQAQLNYQGGAPAVVVLKG
jgi:hypothetical protein